ncbi:MAG: hypothetical protein ACOVN5_12135, partial [Aquidulcibacter sp.]
NLSSNFTPNRVTSQRHSTELSPQEMDEAGEYLIHHGSDCIRRGGLLRRLSRIMQADKQAA